jgi:3-oxoacyl-[acyl-carrier protein] reductase
VEFRQMTEPKTNRRLERQVAIVTGAGRGIGKAEALLLAREGARVVVNDLGGSSAGGGEDPAVAQSVVEEIRREGGDAIADGSDVSTMTGSRALVAKALEHYGQIDILINNAGIARPLRIDQTEESDWDAVVDVNLKSCFATIHAASESFKARKRGVIINTGSPSGFGQYANAAYCAAKEGVIGLTRAVARDLGQFGVRCNAIRPIADGSAMTTPEMIEAVRYSQEVLGIAAGWNRWVGTTYPDARPENVAAVVAWLCTETCCAVNGREFFVAGEEVGLIPEPELIRAKFKIGGWNIDSLEAPEFVRYIIGDLTNRFTGKPNLFV